VTVLAGGGDPAEEGTSDSLANNESSPPEQTTQGAPVSGANGDAKSRPLAPRGAPGGKSDVPVGGDPDPGGDPPPVAGGPGPKPAGGCTITKDSAGFFTRSSGKGSYVGYVPATYDPSTPMRLIIGLH